MNPMRLGIIGMSDGNGHPYSWSAIFNGYDPIAMAKCPFPVIPLYLSKQSFPEDAAGGARVTHVWTQDRALSEHIAQASLINTIVDWPEDMIGEVDAILLARDDAERHLKMARPFLKAGLPIYIDKPLATNLKDAQAIFALESFPGQIFSCSALRYAREFELRPEQLQQLGDICFVQAVVMKSWERYAVHIIEPVLTLLPKRGGLDQIGVSRGIYGRVVTARWESGIQATFAFLGALPSPIEIKLFGTRGQLDLVFEDTFFAFRTALRAFVDGVRERRRVISVESVMEVVEIIERGKDG